MLSRRSWRRGASTSLPTPILPPSPTLENYRTLFGTVGMGRYLLNSLLIASPRHRHLRHLQSHGRLRLRQAALSRPRCRLSPAARRPGDSGPGGDAAALPDAQAAGPDQHLRRRDRAGDGELFGIFLVRQFARGIPDELLEAARIDGAGELRVFTTVVVPLLKPIVVTLAVFSFLAAWNDFMWPLIVLTDDSLHTLPVALAGLSR
jgi:multiple sugar transport system permease protein